MNFFNTIKIFTYQEDNGPSAEQVSTIPLAAYQGSTNLFSNFDGLTSTDLLTAQQFLFYLAVKQDYVSEMDLR